MITSIATIRAEAEAAAKAGKSKNEACRFPFGSPQGVAWVEFYDAAIEAELAVQLARHGITVGVAE